MSQGYPPPNSDPYSAPPQGTGVPVTVRQPATQPKVTYAIIGVTVVVYLLQMVTQYFIGGDYPLYWGAKVNQLIQQGQLWRFFTPMLLHGSILHIGFNMYALYAIGRQLELYYGHWRYLALYVISGFAGNVFSFIFSPNPSLGASTAVFGVLAAEGVFLYQNREMFGQYANRALTQVIMIAAVNLVIGLSPGIDNFGHVGGLVGGALFAWFAGPLLGVAGFYPNFSTVDRRERRSVLMAGLGVSAWFVLLAAATLFIRG
jgi:rhomboid protease GluP